MNVMQSDCATRVVTIGIALDMFTAEALGLVEADEVELVLTAMERSGLSLWPDAEAMMANKTAGPDISAAQWLLDKGVVATGTDTETYEPSDLIWVERVGSTQDERGRGVAVFDDGSAVFTGAFSNTAVFGQGDVNQTTLWVIGVDFKKLRHNEIEKARTAIIQELGGKKKGD